MRFLLTILLLAVLVSLHAQRSLDKLQKRSETVLVYKTSAINAEKFIKWDSIPLKQFEAAPIFHVFQADSIDTQKLPVGHYVLVRIIDNEVVTWLENVSMLVAWPAKNTHRLQWEVRDNDGGFVKDAEVFVAGKKATYHPATLSYWAKQKQVKEALVKVCTPGDTLFATIEMDEEGYKPIWKQRWDNFKLSRLGKPIMWLPNKVNYLFNSRYHYSPQRYKPQGYGYVLFNQPKYRLTDTVKLKAYLLDKHQKQLRKNVEVYLDYYSRNKYNSQLLTRLSPASQGAYVFSFPLSDTLESDTRYNVIFKNKNGKTILSQSFSTEDYVLDEIGSYKFRSEASTWYPGDSLSFYASAKDANGNNLLDGKVRLLLLNPVMNAFYRDSLFVSDTLYNQEKDMETNGETRFVLPASIFPYANIHITAKAIFKNSNNELHEENERVTYAPNAISIEVKEKQDTIIATLRENGKEISATGWVNIEGDLVDKSATITYPAKLKIDPLAAEYEFKFIRHNDTTTNKYQIDYYYRLNLLRISKSDTVGFVLNNPKAIPVNYLVLYGNHVVDEGKSSSTQIMWQRLVPNKHKMYLVKWYYKWGGKDISGQENIGLLYQLLKISINHSPVVFPGQEDSITVSVKDFKGKPAPGVNLSAVAYNTQFKDAIKVEEPPYLARYRNKRTILRPAYDVDDAAIYKKYLLGRYKGWNKMLHTDTLQFYRMLFPDTSLYDVVMPVSKFIPQVSVHVVQQGVPQEIYLLYVNRQLVYYNGVTEKMKEAYSSLQSYGQLGIRLRNQYIELDSIYLQPHYKHHLVIDLDHLPAKTKVEERPAQLTAYERQQLEQTLWQLDNNYQTKEGYVWQGDKVVKLSTSRRSLAGPFIPQQILQFFKPGNFDLNFIFESGYEYNLSKQISRLERKPVFAISQQHVWLKKPEKSTWIIGDTMVPPPTIEYPVPAKQLYLRINLYNTFDRTPGNGAIRFSIADSIALQYVIFYKNDVDPNYFIMPGTTRHLTNMQPGIYTLLLINNRGEAAQTMVVIAANKTLYLKIPHPVFRANNATVNELAARATRPIIVEKPIEEKPSIAPVQNKLPKGNSSISGLVKDAKGGNPVIGASISFKNFYYGTATDHTGRFLLKGLASGIYTLEINSVGYEGKTLTIELEDNKVKEITVALRFSTSNLDEVVVTGLAVRRKTDITGSIAIERENLAPERKLITLLQGNVAGMQDGYYTKGVDVIIRGANSLSAAEQPVYVIDGILYDEMPSHIKPEMIASMEVLKDAAATSLYGARAAYGAIVITTGAKAKRNVFKDYALWQPQFFTNAEGLASFTANYPDNITGWQLFVLGMDKKKRMGKGSSFTQAFKPVSAQLSLPQFLISGDSVTVLGKSFNHTLDDYSVHTNLKVKGQQVATSNFTLKASSANIIEQGIQPTSTDTIKVDFSLSTTTGFKDGEEKNIPVFKQGSEETEGLFTIAPTDTSFTFEGNKNGLPITLFVQNNSLDVLLEELEQLKRFPYYCMEQTASKLKGLVLEQHTPDVLKQPFKEEKQLQSLLKKLQDAQHFDGAWSWWEKGNADLYITSYITEALLPLRQQPLVETNIRNSLLYLQNQLPQLEKQQLLSALVTLSNANHAIDYKPWIEKLVFDSLTQHQQWQWVQIMLKQKLGGERQLAKLVKEHKSTMLGGLSWGSENYHWQSNEIATTILAYKVLEQKSEYQNLLTGIIQFFLEKKRDGYWRNTVETASIIDAILPQMIRNNSKLQSPSVVTVAGDTTITTSTFPYQTKLPAGGKYNITKKGGGISYITLYQKWWNEVAKPATDKFAISTTFEQNGSSAIFLKAGDKATMVIKVDVKADAEYVMLHIPIPAGCNYSSRRQDHLDMHKEYLKNKVVIFINDLSKGVHTFEVELEPRYTGSFTLNPSKAELMYFPTFYGRNEARKLKIK